MITSDLTLTITFKNGEVVALQHLLELIDNRITPKDLDDAHLTQFYNLLREKLVIGAMKVPHE